MEPITAASIVTPLGILAVAVAIAGSVTDVRSRRIPNWLTVGAFMAALIARLAGAEPFLNGLTGAAIAFLVGLSLYTMRAIGAGDVKYLAAFGAILGAGRIWPALLLVTVAAGVLALISAVALGRGPALMRNAGSLAVYCVTLGFRGSRRILSDAETDAALAPIPLGVAIAAGCTLVWFL